MRTPDFLVNSFLQKFTIPYRGISADFVFTGFTHGGPKTRFLREYLSKKSTIFGRNRVFLALVLFQKPHIWGFLISIINNLRSAE
ncbi:hypothetical protein CP500_019590 [Tychonema bourrellyi FEM_GT703]|uniref:Uncharacterized protein n=1 Tax=Tychonema bourrellyi FEM_GT703 TaxID=2040638 RepID=A0A2G4EW83_9CYAN|nr:hypothetical protein CP500_019590 [Tychonema bourrellyi FEM_GT703]